MWLTVSTIDEVIEGVVVTVEGHLVVSLQNQGDITVAVLSRLHNEESSVVRHMD